MKQALYRKYRPSSFKEVAGQDHITKVLAKAIKNGKIAHAYLFSGTRGTGKTTVARILSKEIGTTENDLYEMDAASNRGIDNIRELREAVAIMPFESKYKVYIIDEAHMLTKEAFNALLKTLEEPPEHAVFILATTEAYKLPETIVSRCEVYEFKKPSQEVLRGVLEKVAKEEGYKFDSAALELMTILSDGAFRDALGVLQKVINGSKDKKISLGEVEAITGAPPQRLINDVIKSIALGELGDGLKTLSQTVDKNVDMKIFMKLLLVKLRLALLLRYAKGMAEEIEREVGEDEMEFLSEMSKSVNLNSHVLKELLEAYNQMSFAYITHLPLELALIKISGKE